MNYCSWSASQKHASLSQYFSELAAIITCLITMPPLWSTKAEEGYITIESSDSPAVHSPKGQHCKDFAVGQQREFVCQSSKLNSV